MSPWWIPLQVAAFAYVFVLPGVLTLRGSGPDWPAPVRWAAALTVGLLVVPMACFCAAWVLGTNVQPPLVLAVATIVNAIAGGLAWRRRGKERA
jgi:hypothetical protein